VSSTSEVKMLLSTLFSLKSLARDALVVGGSSKEMIRWFSTASSSSSLVKQGDDACGM